MKKEQKNIYARIGSLLPHKYVDLMQDIFTYSGKRDTDAQEYLGGITILSLLIGGAVMLIPYSFALPFGILNAVYALLGMVLIHYLSYLICYIGLEDYTKRIESVVPDFLRLVASNIRAGITPFQALRLSARPEFGPLRDEVEYVTVRGLGSDDFAELLGNINKHIRSESLERVLRLFSSTIKSGGKLALVLEESATDIEEKRRLKKELQTITKSYSIFIMFAVIILAPFLLAISIQFLSMVINIQSITPTAAQNVGGFGGKVSIGVEFLRTCSTVFLILTGIFASMLSAVIQQEKMQYGLKYAIIIVTCSMVAFLGANNIIGQMFAK